VTDRDTTDRDMTQIDLAELASIVTGQPYPLVFATVSGAHLYGFPSRDSDVDLRGSHLLPLPELVGLRHGPDTVDRSWTSNDMQIDLVTHEAAKFFRLLLRRNGYVHEQLVSPLVVTTSPLHSRLIDLAPRLLTRHHAHHYRGFANTQRQLFVKTGQLKPLLYTFRTLLTGIHLMHTGHVQAHLPTLIDHEDAPAYLTDLIDAKTTGEHATVTRVAAAPPRHRINHDLDTLLARLDQAQTDTHLPDSIDATPELHELLVAARLD
jgi:predicted nucleotidyltransferase